MNIQQKKKKHFSVGYAWELWKLNHETFRYDCQFCDKSFSSEWNAKHHCEREVLKEKKGQEL